MPHDDMTGTPSPSCVPAPEAAMRMLAARLSENVAGAPTDFDVLVAAAEEIDHLRAALKAARDALPRWRDMSTAPDNGKHCLLYVNEGAFFYSVQGAYQDGKWNALHRGDVSPIYWMPNMHANSGPYAYVDEAEGALEVRAAETVPAASQTEPVAHLVWRQGRVAADDVADYHEVARPGDTSVDGSEPFPVWSHPTDFLHRLIENAFSWALGDCNYLSPKYMERLIAATKHGMRPELAAVWNATSKEQASARRRKEDHGVFDLHGRDIYEVANQLGGYVDPSTPPALAKFLLREAEAATLLADEIRNLRTDLARKVRLKPFVWHHETLPVAVEGVVKVASHHWTLRPHVPGFLGIPLEIDQYVDERFPSVPRTYHVRIGKYETERDTLESAKAVLENYYADALRQAFERLPPVGRDW